MFTRRRFSSLLIAVFSLFIVCAGAIAADEVCGPINLLKTMRTPFGAPGDGSGAAESSLSPLSLQTNGVRSLSGRLLAPRLYLPGHMTIGSTAEFIIKGRPGCWAALAMADRDTGAKPIYGHAIRLGPDRKVVSLGQIPESGVLSLVIDTPIEGDLIGLPLYFEAAVWSRPDFSDMELATPVMSESAGLPAAQHSNGVLVAAEPEHKRGIRFVPDGTAQMQQIKGQTSLDSGRP
ncbi:MAG TPA: hypothetical protein V6D22_01300 [Candidatus Obscuribacterales bacterium]